MNKLILIFLIASGTFLQAECQPYTFFEKAKEHYLARGKIVQFENNLIDSLLSSPETSSLYTKAFDASWKIGLFFLEKGEHTVALDIFDKMRIHLEALQDKSRDEMSQLSMVYNIIGAIYEETGLWNEALDRYMQSLQICNQINNQAGKARVYNNIGKIYFNRNDLKKAEELFLKAIDINKRLEYNSALFDNYVNLGGIYRQKGDYEKALEISLLALSKLDIDNDAYNLSIIYSNIGNLYQDMGNNPMALTYYQQSVNMSLKKSFGVILIESYLSIASVFRTLNELDSSGVYILKSLEVAENLGNPLEKSRVLKDVAEYYKEIGDFKTSNHYFGLYTALYDSLVKLNSLTKVEQIQAVYEVINKEKDNEILLHKVNIQQLALQRQRIILAGAIVLFLFLAYVVFNMQRNRKRERANNEYIQKQTELFHQKEKEMMLTKERNLELELEFRRKELTLNVMSLMKLNEMLSEISERIINSAKSAQHQETRDVLKKIGKDIQRSTDAETLKEFTLRFKEVNQAFFDALLSRYPDLTPQELKICAFLKLNMSTKEISELTGQNIKAIEIARYRLRQKLGISNSDANLVTFMTQFN